MTEAELRAATVGELAAHDAPVTLVDYDPDWPRLYAREGQRIRGALGNRVVALEHVGSTSVPGLAAKPIIDILLVVADSVDEAAYVPQLEGAGYVLRLREPGWFEHRMLKGPDTNANLHVLPRNCVEIERMIRFRDHLRSSDDDRQLYERTKRDLAVREWKYVQNYADAKSDVVGEIMRRALPTGS
ncbi:MAG: GrpB family protein [Gaiellaceae bacterium]